MGCTPSVSAPSSGTFKILNQRRSIATVGTSDGFETGDGHIQSIRRRIGHPTSYQDDGFDLGIRVRIKGAFQSYYVGTSRKTKEKVTIKEHHINKYPDDSCAIKEIFILSHLSHTVIPHLQEVFISNKSSIFLVMEFIEPSRLLNFIDFKTRKTQFSLLDIRQILKSIGEAIAHCHDQGFILRDLTPANIVVKRKGIPSSESNSSLSSIPSHEASPSLSPTTGHANVPVSITLSQAATQLSSTPTTTTNPNTNNHLGYDVKIVDFSFAVRDGSHEFLGSHPLFDWSMVPYCAPEALLSPGHYHPTLATASVVPSHFSYEMDMWSLGVLLYVMISGELPFGGYETSTTMEDHVLIHNIRHAQFNFDRNVAWKDCGESVKKLIRKLLTVDRQHRMNVKDFVKSPWLEISNTTGSGNGTGGGGNSNSNLLITHSGKGSPPTIPNLLPTPLSTVFSSTAAASIASTGTSTTTVGGAGAAVVLKEKSLSTSSPNALAEEEEAHTIAGEEGEEVLLR